MSKDLFTKRFTEYEGNGFVEDKAIMKLPEYPEHTVDKKIGELVLGERVYYGFYLMAFTVTSVKANGFPLVVIENEKTKLTLRGFIKVRSTRVTGKEK